MLNKHFKIKFISKVIEATPYKAPSRDERTSFTRLAL